MVVIQNDIGEEEIFEIAMIMGVRQPDNVKAGTPSTFATKPNPQLLEAPSHPLLQEPGPTTDEKPHFSPDVLPILPEFHFDASVCFTELRAQLKLCGNKTVKNALGGVLDSLQNAVKTNGISDKYKELRGKVLRVWDEALIASGLWESSREADFQSAYFLLGVLALCAKDYSYALEPLVRAGKYQLAAWAAERNGTHFL